MEKLNITQGEWLIGENSNSVEVETNLTDRGRLQLFYCLNVPANQRKDNAVLIADAGTTYNTAPILPSDLLKQRNDLLAALFELRNAVFSENDIRLLAASQSAKDLINKINATNA